MHSGSLPPRSGLQGQRRIGYEDEPPAETCLPARDEARPPPGRDIARDGASVTAGGEPAMYIRVTETAFATRGLVC